MFWSCWLTGGWPYSILRGVAGVFTMSSSSFVTFLFTFTSLFFSSSFVLGLTAEATASCTHLRSSSRRTFSSSHSSLVRSTPRSTPSYSRRRCLVQSTDECSFDFSFCCYWHWLEVGCTKIDIVEQLTPTDFDALNAGAASSIMLAFISVNLAALNGCVSHVAERIPTIIL